MPALIADAFGIGTLVWPGLSLLVLPSLFAAIRLRRAIDYEWALGASGVVSILFGGLRLRRVRSRADSAGVTSA